MADLPFVGASAAYSAGFDAIEWRPKVRSAHELPRGTLVRHKILGRLMFVDHYARNGYVICSWEEDGERVDGRFNPRNLELGLLSEASR